MSGDDGFPSTTAPPVSPISISPDRSVSPVNFAVPTADNVKTYDTNFILSDPPCAATSSVVPGEDCAIFPYRSV